MSTAREDDIVHLLRHGEVHNPQGILYGRSTGFHLSERGRAMADRVADRIGDRDITHIVSSPLERAQETATPLAAARGLTVRARRAGDRVGQRLRGQAVRHPRLDPAPAADLAQPVEPVPAVVGRALQGGRRADVAGRARRPRGGRRARGGHRLPPAADLGDPAARPRDARFLHDPRKRHCTLCSLTSFTFDDERLVSVGYSEPAGDLIPLADRSAPFSAGGADDEHPAARWALRA